MSVWEHVQRVMDPLKVAAEPFRAVPRPDHAPFWEGRLWGLKLAFYPEQFYLQLTLLGCAVVYALLALIGRWRNRRIVRPFVETYARVLKDEFALVGTGKDELVWNGAASTMLFATGRRAVDSLQATIVLTPRHDLLRYMGAWVYDLFALPSTPSQVHDHVVLTLRLPHDDDMPVGTFALIDKSVLQQVRHGRFDLSFARIADGEKASAQRGLDERFAIASENGHLTDLFLGEVGARGDEQRARLGLTDALNGSAGPYIESFVVTDQPVSCPRNGAPPLVSRVELTLRLPRSERAARDTLPALTAALDVADARYLAVIRHTRLLALRPDAVTALKKTRSEVARMLAEEANEAAEQDARDARDDARRKVQQEKFDKLSPAEQEKRRQVERRRAQRKAQTQGMRRR